MNDDNNAPIDQEQANTDTSNHDALGQDATVQQPARKISKKVLIICGLLAVIVAAGLVYFLLNSADETKKENSDTTTGSTTLDETVNTATEPFTLAYAHAETVGGEPKVYWRSTDGGDRTEVQAIAKNNYLSQSAIHGEQVAFVTEAGSGADENTTIWYSKDAGKTYKSIYQGKAAEGYAISTQITSLVFSSDGSSLLAGILPSGSDGNNVTEIQPESGETKVLFIQKQPGVFLEGYDSATKKVVYFKGCYNCDANTFTELFMRDLTNNSDTTLLTAPTWIKIAIKADFSSLVARYGVEDPKPSEGLGINILPPYTIKEISLTGGASKDIALVDEQVNSVGYTADTGAPYYVTDKQVVLVANKNVLYESSNTILDVFYASSKSVITSSGEFNNFILNKFVLGDKSNTQLLNGTEATRIFGITKQ